MPSCESAFGPECVKTLRQNFSAHGYAQTENYRQVSDPDFA
jgi:hypothetical protein